MDQHHIWIRLVELFYQQIRYGCTNPDCNKPTCRTCCTRLSGRRPYRVPTTAAAKHLACIAASQPRAATHLCTSSLQPMDEHDGAFSQRPPEEAFDTKSIVQQLFSTKAWHGAQEMSAADVGIAYLYKSIRAKVVSDSYGFDKLVDQIIDQLEAPSPADQERAFTSLSEYALAELRRSQAQDSDHRDSAGGLLGTLVIAAAVLRAFIGDVSLENFQLFEAAISDGPIFSTDLCRSLLPKLPDYIRIVENRPTLALAEELIRIVHRHNLHRQLLVWISRQNANRESVGSSWNMSIRVIVTWAKLVFRSTWKDNEVEIAPNGITNAALQFLDRCNDCAINGAAPYDSPGPLGFVARNLDIIKAIGPWMRQKDSEDNVHLLEFPWMFTLRERLILFRAANYTLMLTAFEKAKEVSQLVEKTHCTTLEAASAQARHQDVLDRMRASSTAFLVLQIRREHILEDALSQLWRREARELRRPLKIKMGMDMGEEGIDLGGVQQEFFRLAIAESLNPDLGFFDVDPVTQIAWFKPLSAAPLFQFALVGMLFGLAVYNSITIPVTFPRYFYRLLMHDPENLLPEPSLADIEDGWPVLFRSFSDLLAYEGDDVEETFSLDHSFAIDVHGKLVVLDMNGEVPSDTESALLLSENSGSVGAKAVTKGNRHDYTVTYLTWLLNKSIQRQLHAFLRGFRSVINQRTLALFRDSKEFKEAVEGTQTIELSDLKQIAKYLDGYTQDSTTITQFWEIVDEYSQDELRKLLEFVTASERIPAAGIQDLSFVIQKNGTEDDRLPTSMTCFGRLLLPQYSSKQVLQARLKVALENCEGFGVA